jgi:3-isopropylmalate/(R)-2-methylmalate dehydratase large subunit
VAECCERGSEGGARVGYVNPDATTFEYLKGRRYAPKGTDWDPAVARWLGFASDAGAAYDDVLGYRAEDIAPTVTWGINPGQAIFIDEAVPHPAELPEKDRATAEEALEHMKLRAGRPIKGTPVDVVFLGSCTNARLSDLTEVAAYLKGKKVKPGVKAIVVPGSQGVSALAEKMGLAEIYREAGFEWRGAGCSMCLGMNPDKLTGDQLCASSSNRNFKGRQGSPTGRTVLMSPLMVAAAAVTGEIADAREVFSLDGTPAPAVASN